MVDLVTRNFQQWTAGKAGKDAMVAIYNHIRDIPYKVLTELNDPENFKRILEVNAGSCTPKHLLMAEMYSRLGLDVLLVVYPYRWTEFKDIYPPHLWELAQGMPPANHLACLVFINGRYVLVDATVDLPLGIVGIPVNKSWNGESDTILPVLPTGNEEIYHPGEAALMPPPDTDPAVLSFYNRLNEFLDGIRYGQH